MRTTRAGDPPGRSSGSPRGSPPLYGAIDLVGWAEPPHYNKEGNRLYWAKHLKFEGGTDDTLNDAIRVLGRNGVLELNAVTGMNQLASIKKEMAAMLPRAEFNEGNRYADFNPDIDQYRSIYAFVWESIDTSFPRASGAASRS